jgi:hypothetical protein
MYLLANIGEDRQSWGSHRAILLVLVVLSSITSTVQLWRIPKRQVFYMCSIAGMGPMMCALDSVWNCIAIQSTLKILGMAVSMILMSIMRKMAARLSGDTTTEQLTIAQKCIFAASVFTSILVGACPDLVPFAVVELGLFILMLLIAWKCFFAFATSSNGAFKSAFLMAAKTKSVEQRKKHAKGAKRNTGRNMPTLLLVVHYTLAHLRVFSTILLETNVKGYSLRRVNDLQKFEMVRFYTSEVGVVIIAVAQWHAVLVFSTKKKKA